MYVDSTSECKNSVIFLELLIFVMAYRRIERTLLRGLRPAPVPIGGRSSRPPAEREA